MECRVCKTLKEMLNDRGHTVENFESLNELNIFPDALVIYIDSEKLGVQHVKTIEGHMKDYPKNTSILVYKNSITSFAKNALDALENKIEIFCFKQLTYNVTQHKLVPKHILLSKDEKQSVITQFRVSESKIPLISEDDPICRYFNAKVGSMFKILRPSNITGTSVYYRIVSKST